MNTCFNCGIETNGVYCPLCDPYRDMPEFDLRQLLHERDAKITMANKNIATLIASMVKLRTVDSASDGARGASDSEPNAAQREGKPE